MPKTDIVTPRARTLAAEIREVRTDAGCGLRELARRIGIHFQLLSQWEYGLRTPRLEDVTAILGALGVVGDRKQRILALTRGASEPGWITYGPAGMQLTAVIECEKAARSIVEWSPTGIPGLLQTPGYARAMFTAYGRTAEEADRRVALRMKRAEMLAADRTFEAIIGEAALRDRIGTPTTMFDQLHSLIEKSTRSVTLRVVPAACGWHPGLAGPFLLYSLTDGSSVVYLEHLSCGAFVLDGHDVGVYRAGLKKLRALAMSETDSQAFIGRLADEIEGVELSALAGQ
ncbi:helix-turn-helix transcriptional regulator [Amycolatopsis sp. DG1A-15b]|uniref:helix-turn-helix domain-containing protein n=1 Tax=Amycolatopsis sp. DG1A-15b TaxID=3052846 RepID=UPI00255BFC9C|nr:helix-turn-helix transcriptional regulator [Amycolatopsis sp. DG1A-15b]WIX87008.1 helix-turn-helix transcriptional regulator [Amycolatopsis sp. DG1A-15b]